MKKTILAITLALASMGASAHQRPTTHYHDDGRVVYGNYIAPKVEVTNERDRYGRDIRVTTTTSCVDQRVNRRNNHLRCREQETRVERQVIDRPHHPAMPNIEPHVQRFIERDHAGRRFIVTVTDTCERPGYNRRGEPVCYAWNRTIDRDYVRWNRHQRDLDLDGDGRTNAWEQLLYQGFREILENN
jgi:hypothetical protein